MPNEWIPVVSDAVKIGLGAVIGGVFTLIGSITAHRLKSSGEHSQRRREALYQAAQEFDPIAITGLARASALTTYYETADDTRDLYSEMETELVKARSPAQCLKELHSIETRMALFSFSTLAKAIEAYRTTLHALEQEEEKPASSATRFADLAKKLAEHRAEVIAQFSNGYKRA